jgi:D-glycero-alpha-D-manno-heptose-7-phosphate kinase
MIITRTPLRISLGGGATDLPTYYREHGGGFLVAAAISRHIYVAVNDNFDHDLLLKYSSIERVSEVASIEHPILREALTIMDIERGIEISSMADIPAGTGLGSSGAFTVGALKGLHAYRRLTITNEDLAEMACHIEIERLGEPVGKQDQYAAAIGGVTAFTFHPDDRVTFEPVPMTKAVLDRFEENLLLFYTGVRRSASEEITEQMSELGTLPRAAENLDAVRQIGYDSRDAMAAGDLNGFAGLMNRQWELKFQRSPSEMHQQVNGWIQRGRDAGAAGGKLVGAGGGGFLLFYADSKSDLRAEMAEIGLEEVRFAFDFEGSRIMVA